MAAIPAFLAVADRAVPSREPIRPGIPRKWKAVGVPGRSSDRESPRMPQLFRDDPATPGDRIWRRSSWRALGSGFVALLCAILLIMSTAAVIDMVRSGQISGAANLAWALGGLALFVGLMGALFRLVWRDMRGKLGAQIRLTHAGVRLQLRSGRSLIHETHAVDETVPWPDVLAVETRLEAYGAQGMASLQRAYRLTRRNGAPIYLFEQRGLRTNLETDSMQAVAEEIAERGGVRLIDRGMVKGKGGFLAAWFVEPSDWSAPSISGAEQQRMARRAAMTASIAAMVVGGFWLLRALAAAF
ncbi:MAG: hypothetical protein U5K74_12715 [Gemmatimonadaceae bacterium]|nr:hypothetical protein [Gemmatimonadaceae bacterium]